MKFILIEVLFFCFEIYSAKQWYADDTFRLPRREPVAVGFERQVQISLDRMHTLKTLSVDPPIFEIRDFLSPEECEYLVYLAKSVGLDESPVHKDIGGNFTTSREVFAEWDANADGFIDQKEFTYIKGKGDVYIDENDVDTMFEFLKIDKNGDEKMDMEEFFAVTAERIGKYFKMLYVEEPRVRSRKSRQAFLWHYGAYDQLLEGFHERIARLTMLPHDLIEVSEPMQVVQYLKGGHYHCHHDSDEVSHLPCCTYNNQHSQCRICRYLTVMYYLNNVTREGETAFPVADNDTFSEECWAQQAPIKCNLAKHCQESNLVYKPLQGTALLWYNHKVAQDGWLGGLDPRTYHGGCDVTGDEHKWIANTWIDVIGGKGSLDSYNGWLGHRSRPDEL